MLISYYKSNHIKSYPLLNRLNNISLIKNYFININYYQRKVEQKNWK